MATDPLFGTTAVSVTTTAVSTSSTATMAGECVIVTVGNIDTGPFAANASVRVRNTTNKITTGWQSCGLLAPTQVATQYHDIPVASGDTVVVDIIAPATLTAAKTTIAAVLTTTAMHPLLRSDGRGMPLGAQVAAYASASVGGVTMVPSVGAGFMILVQAMTLLGQASTANGELYFDNGSIQTILLQVTGDSASSLSPPGGILSLPNSYLTGYNFTNTVYSSGQVFYDIVPV
jgi:hypothetical protein